MNVGDIVIVGDDARLIVSSRSTTYRYGIEVVFSNGDMWALNTKTGLGRQLNAPSWLPLVTWFYL